LRPHNSHFSAKKRAGSRQKMSRKMGARRRSRSIYTLEKVHGVATSVD
jgi:hypothetical protein